MSIVSDVSNVQIPSEIISTNGEIVAIFLVIIISMSFLLSDTKYWNGYVSNILNTFSKPLLLVFIAIVIFKVILII